jgi:hypothetical protein
MRTWHSLQFKYRRLFKIILQLFTVEANRELSINTVHMLNCSAIGYLTAPFRMILWNVHCSLTYLHGLSP